ncbi:MAG TPA: hypothetical protein PLV65_11985, partial [Tenuifilaceae bacterium]|nr:hypothetical protein [Tenuifilaceae bacterium]
LFQFDLLVRTAILRLMGGSSPQREMLKMPIAHDYKRKRSERLALAPAKVNGNGEVELLNYHGSAHIFALAQAQFMVMVPIGISQLKKGDLVNVRSV